MMQQLNIVSVGNLNIVYTGHASTFLELKDHGILTEIHFHIIKTVMVSYRSTNDKLKFEQIKCVLTLFLEN